MDITVNKFDPYNDCLCESYHYMILWMKEGVTSISIDINKFFIASNSIWFITPGNKVMLEFESNPSGWVIKFSKPFFNSQIRENLTIKDVDLFTRFDEVPKIILSPKIGDRVHSIAEMIDEMIGSEIPNKEAAVASLFKTLMIYCDSKCNIRLNGNSNQNKIRLVTNYKDLVAKHFTKIHQVKEYASMMNISPKYLNQLVREILGVTAKSIIIEQLMIRARHDLKFSNLSVKEIAFSLGFSEPCHFSNFFKREFKCSPSKFRQI